MNFLRKNSIAVAILIAVFAAISIYVVVMRSKFSYQLKTQGIRIGIAEDFKVKDISKDKIEAENDGEILKIEIIDNVAKEGNDKYLQREFTMLKSIFEPQLPPYPEFLTKESGCAERYRPIEKDSKYGRYFILYAGERLGYGVCVDDLIKYRASLGYFHCKNSNKIFKVQYFVKKEDGDDKIINFNNSFVCLNN